MSRTNEFSTQCNVISWTYVFTEPVMSRTYELSKYVMLRTNECSTHLTSRTNEFSIHVMSWNYECSQNALSWTNEFFKHAMSWVYTNVFNMSCHEHMNFLSVWCHELTNFLDKKNQLDYFLFSFIYTYKLSLKSCISNIILKEDGKIYTNRLSYCMSSIHLLRNMVQGTWHMDGTRPVPGMTNNSTGHHV